MMYSIKLNAEEFFMVKKGLVNLTKFWNGNLSVKGGGGGGILAEKFC